MTLAVWPERYYDVNFIIYISEQKTNSFFDFFYIFSIGYLKSARVIFNTASGRIG